MTNEINKENTEESDCGILCKLIAGVVILLAILQIVNGIFTISEWVQTNMRKNVDVSFQRQKEMCESSGGLYMIRDLNEITSTCTFEFPFTINGVQY